MAEDGMGSPRTTSGPDGRPDWLRDGNFARRDVLRLGAIGGIAFAGGGLLSACGGGTGSQNATAGTTGKPKRGGTLRLGISGGGSSEVINPLIPVLGTDFLRIAQVFDPLIVWDDQLKPTPALAESMTSNSDATQWTIRLRDGVTFHNGKSLTADDVIFTFQKILDKKSPGYGAASISRVDAANIKKLDRLTLRIPCTAPFSTFMETLPDYYFNIIPVGFDPKRPVGTGPFVVKSFTPGRQSVMDRNPNYWQNGLPYVDRLIMINFSDETSQVNALSGGQVDAVDLISAASINAVKAAGNQVVTSNGGGMSPWTMRSDEAPFDDVRVRQAMRLLVDRKQIVDVVYGGQGVVGNDVFGSGDKTYDAGLPARQYDVAQAKSMLRAAGHEGLSVELVVAPLAQGAVQAATLFKEQAKKAGVTINIRQITTTAWQANYLKWPFANTFWYHDAYFVKVGSGMLPTSPFNETHFKNSSYTALYQKALATTDKAARVSIAHDMQKIDYDQGSYIIPCLLPLAEGLAKNVRGDKPSASGQPFNNGDLKSMWLD